MATRGETTENTFEISKKLPFDVLSKSTNNFSDERKLGRSQFGTIYKGIMDDGKVIIVKKLENYTQVPPDKTLQNEVEKLLKLKHENLVELVGYCSEETEIYELSGEMYNLSYIAQNLLCYEYFSYWNLADYLFGTITAMDFSSAEPGTSKVSKGFSSAEPSIDWDARFKIINGICRGLLFLHGLDRPIIHMDLRVENIWLDSNIVPKIGNFGLSRLFDQDTTKMNTQNVVGTYGHMAPEYFYGGVISTQADIYSLGLLIFEITTGEKNCPDDKQPCGREYIKKIRTGWTEENIASKYSSLDAGQLHQIHACIKTGLECVDVERKNRPTIQVIIDKLNAS